MTKLFYSDPPEEPSWKSNTDREGDCSYTIDKSEWEGQYPSDFLGDEKWICPHHTKDSQDYCIFHKSIEDKGDAEVQAEFESVLGSEHRPSVFLGAEFGTIDIRDRILQDCDESKIILKNCIFHSTVSLVEVVSRSKIEFAGSIFHGQLSIIDSLVEKQIQLDHTIFYPGSTLSFTRSRFERSIDISDSILSDFFCYDSHASEGVDIRDSVFTKMATFQRSTFSAGIRGSSAKFTYETDDICPSFHDSEFQDDLWLQDTEYRSACGFGELEIDGKLNLLRADFDEQINLERSQFQELILSSATIPRFINLSSTQVDEIHLQDISITSEANVSLIRAVKSNILSGKIFQPAKGDLLLDFSGGVIGDISLKPEDHVSILSPMTNFTQLFVGDVDVDFNKIRFFETKFEGFEFEDYLVELEAVDWRIHELEGKAPRSNTLEFEINSHSDDSDVMEGEYQIERELMTDENLIPTYLKAKHGANTVGDNKAAAEFLIKEMAFRKSHHKNRFKSKLRSIVGRGGTEGQLKSGGKWLLNSFLEVTCGYGERLWAIVVYSVLLILDYSLLYPLLGGLSDNTTTYSYSSVQTTSDLVSVLIHSLYFSSATFTTLGAGELSPVGEFSKILSVTEAFTGTFLVALLLFTFGRKVSR